jgi:hypothetical protein
MVTMGFISFSVLQLAAAALTPTTTTAPNTARHV